MTEQPLNAPLSGVSAEFGYYPVSCNIETEKFSVQTLPDHDSIIAGIRNNPDIHDNWIYPGPQLQRDFMSRNVYSMPYSARIFGLPKTHVLKLHKSESREELNFIVWCLSFFTGMRLTTTERGFLDATPIKPGKLVDFVLSCCTEADIIDLALNYLESERDDPRAPKRIKAVIHALFLAQYPQSLDFERFQYSYMALDGCFKLVAVKEAKKPRMPHAERIQWMCEKFGLKWIRDAKEVNEFLSSLSNIRNNTFHETLFFDEPLGFSIYGGNQPTPNSRNVTLKMLVRLVLRALVCRLLVAILGQSGDNYVTAPVDTRDLYKLKLRG